MCVIITSPDRQHRPTLDTLRLCAQRNRDGSGIAWISDHKIQFVKGLKPEQIAELLPTLPGPVVIHFRFATIGGKSTALCHPFPVTEDAATDATGSAKRVLFHNGTWHGFEQFAKDMRIELRGPVSDTRLAAVGAWLGGKDFLRTLPGRFALFSRKGIRRFGHWHELKGMHFSNLDWMPVRSTPAATAPAALPALVKQAPKTHGVYRYTGPSRSLVEQAMACFAD